MPRDWLGSGAISIRTTAERIIAEAIRRFTIVAKNDANIVPRANDASNILAARRFVVPVSIPERAPSDTNDILAGRAFARMERGGNGTPLNIPWTLILRGAAGDFEAGTFTGNVVLRGGTGVNGAIYVDVNEGTVIRVKPGAVHDLNIENATFSILRVPTGTQNVEIANGSLLVGTRFGCNGKLPQPALAVGGAVVGVAGAANLPYDAPTQTLINDLAAQVNVQAALLNSLRQALRDNGIVI